MENEQNKSSPPPYELRKKSKRCYKEDESSPQDESPQQDKSASPYDYIYEKYDCFETEEKVRVKRKKNDDDEESGSSNVSVCSGPGMDTSETTRNAEVQNLVPPENTSTPQNYQMTVDDWSVNTPGPSALPADSVQIDVRQMNQCDELQYANVNITY